MNWLYAALIAMVAFGINNVVLKLFLQKGDWRIFIPLVSIAAVGLTVYFIMVMREVNFSKESITLGFALLVLGGASALFFLIAVNEGPLSIVMPVTALSVIITVVIQVYLGAETLKPTTVAGVIMGLVSIALLTS